MRGPLFLFAAELPVFLTMFQTSFSPSRCLSPASQPSRRCSRGPLGCLFALSFMVPFFFFNHHCGKTGMCHYLLLAAAVRKPNYHGSQCLVAVYRCAVSICVCVGLVLVSSCPKPQWQRLQEMVTVASADSEEKEAVKLMRDLLCVALPPWHRSPPPPLCPLTSANRCLTS